LNQTIETLKGKEEEKAAGGMKVHFPYSIDERYIENTADRIRIYKRILEANDMGGIYRLKDELEDQYGRLPPGMDGVFYVGAVKLFARRSQWTEVDVFPDRIRCQVARPFGKMQLRSLKMLKVIVIDDSGFELFHDGFTDFVRRYEEIAPFLPHS